MIGAVIGDLAGSIYEYDQTKKITSIQAKQLLLPNSFISDDTILTMAIINAIVNDCSYEESLKSFGIKYENMMPQTQPYFATIFSPDFSEWLHGNFVGKSSGNGAMMRISPIGYLFNSESEIEKQAGLATAPSHNTTEAISCATIIAKIIYFARNHFSKEEILRKLHITLKKPIITSFNYTCQDTIDICLWSLFNANSFAESIYNALSFGGDTDTNASIVGSMAEAMFGIDEELKMKALSYLPNEFQELLQKAYQRIL